MRRDQGVSHGWRNRGGQPIGDDDWECHLDGGHRYEPIGEEDTVSTKW